MNLLSPLVESVGWTLLHFVWQAAAAALLLRIVLLCTPRDAAPVRSRACGGALILLVAAAAITFTGTWKDTISQHRSSPQNGILGSVAAVPARPAPVGDGVLLSAAESPSGFAAPDSGEEGSSFRPENPAGLRSETTLREASARLRPYLPWIVAVWATGVALFSLRLGVSWIAARALVSNCSPAIDPLLGRFERLCGRLRINTPVRLMISMTSRVPVMIGWLRPVVLIPAALIASLTPPQIDALLTHELAHARRRDWLFNLLQCVVETLFFYHPAVWWISSQLRTEREHCCDDIAAETCGDTVTYARALTALEEQRSRALSVAANDGPLLQRIRRLVRTSGQTAQASGWGGVLAAVILTATAVVPVCLAQDVPERQEIPGRVEAGTGDQDGAARMITVTGPEHSGVSFMLGDRTLCALYFPGSLKVEAPDPQASGVWNFITALRHSPALNWNAQISAEAPDILKVGTQSFDLRKGRVIILQKEGDPLQIDREMALKKQSDLELIGKTAENEIYLARAYRYSRVVQAMSGWLLSWESQNPISHSDGAHQTLLRIFPDGRVIVPNEWAGLLEDRLSAQDLQSLIAALKGTGAFTAQPAGEGSPASIRPGSYALWDQEVSTVALMTDGQETLCLNMSASRTAGIPREGVNDETWNVVSALLIKVINRAQAGGPEGIARAAAFADQQLQARIPGAVAVRPGTVWAGFASVGDRLISFRAGDDAEDHFPRGKIVVRFPREGAPWVEEAEYRTARDQPAEQWGRDVELRKKKEMEKVARPAAASSAGENSVKPAAAPGP